jgi:hypothetical protein
MASGALGRITVILHHDGTSRSRTANRIFVWRVLVEWSHLVPFRGIEQLFAAETGSCGSLVRLIAVSQRCYLPFITLEQVLQSVGQISCIKCSC